MLFLVLPSCPALPSVYPRCLFTRWTQRTHQAGVTIPLWPQYNSPLISKTICRLLRPLITQGSTITFYFVVFERPSILPPPTRTSTGGWSTANIWRENQILFIKIHRTHRNEGTATVTSAGIWFIVASPISGSCFMLDHYSQIASLLRLTRSPLLDHINLTLQYSLCTAGSSACLDSQSKIEGLPLRNRK